MAKEKQHRTTLANLIARTMTDDSFRAQFLADPKAALTEAGLPVPAGTNVKALEQTSGTHYFIVPAGFFANDGTPKGKLLHRLSTDPELKARFINDPQAVLQERGIAMPAGVDLQIIVNTPDSMTIAIPEKVSGPTELSEAELAIAAGGSSHSNKHHSISPPSTIRSDEDDDDEAAEDAGDAGDADIGY